MPSKSQGAQIRQFLIENVAKHPRDLAAVTAEHFGITPQAVNHHLRKLTADRLLQARGNTRGRSYKLVAETVEQTYLLTEARAEDVVWRDLVAPLLKGVPKATLDICHYGFTEMVNNAIDHSEGRTLSVRMVKTAASVEFWIDDDGVGIFRKIQQALALPNDRDAIVELAKGKFTTDPARHTGEGIFFSSRVFDSFSILSHDLFFLHQRQTGDWLVERASPGKGTRIQMSVNVPAEHTLDEVFDQFTAPDEFAFSMTHVPVALAQHGEENLVSRSQAKRLVRGFEKFEQVVLDFADVESIGQAFADEIFRVFQLQHPQLRMQWVNTAPAVDRMISRARAQLSS